MAKLPPSMRLALAKLACLLLAGLFLLGAIAKGQDLYGFMLKAAYYRAIPQSLLLKAALATVALEAALSVLLLFRLRLLFALRLTLALLFTFSAAIIYAVQRFGIDDCGCLGSLAETPPTFALGKNAVAILLAFYAYRVAKRGELPPANRLRVGLAWGASCGLGALLAWMIVPTLS